MTRSLFQKVSKMLDGELSLRKSPALGEEQPQGRGDCPVSGTAPQWQAQWAQGWRGTCHLTTDRLARQPEGPLLSPRAEGKLSPYKSAKLLFRATFKQRINKYLKRLGQQRGHSFCPSQGRPGLCRTQRLSILRETRSLLPPAHERVGASFREPPGPLSGRSFPLVI